MYFKNLNFKLLGLTLLFLCLTFTGSSLLFSFLTPPVYGAATANAWNLERVGTDLNFYFSNTSLPIALQLNQGGTAQIHSLIDMDATSKILDPSATSSLNALNTTGSVAIGTTTASRPLQVHSATAANQVYLSSNAPAIVFGNNVAAASSTITAIVGLGTAASQFLGGSGDLNVYTLSGANSIILGAAGSEKMRVTSTGVSIGAGNQAPGGPLQVGRNDTLTNNRGGILVASGTGGGGARQYWIGAASNPSTHNGTNFAIADFDGVTTTNLMTIMGAHNPSNPGYIGIGGSTNPVAKLEINAGTAANNTRGIRLISAEATPVDFRIFADTAAVGAGVIGTESNHSLRFYTGGTFNATNTKMTIESGGNVGIGTTGPQSKLHVGGGVNLGGAARFEGAVGMNGYAPQSGLQGCTTGFGLCVGGMIGGQGLYQNISDVRLKKNITTIPDALKKVMSLHGVYYDFKELDGVYKTLPKGKQVGFIAQEVEPILPEIVTTGTDGIKMLGLSGMNALIIEAMKEQQHQIEAEKAKNDQQQLEIEQLKQELEQLKNK